MNYNFKTFDEWFDFYYRKVDIIAKDYNIMNSENIIKYLKIHGYLNDDEQCNIIKCGDIYYIRWECWKSIMWYKPTEEQRKIQEEIKNL